MSNPVASNLAASNLAASNLAASNLAVPNPVSSGPVSSGPVSSGPVSSGPVSSKVLALAPAPTELAVAHFAARLSFETDVSDVHADLAAGTPGLVVVDSRSLPAWEQGHLPGALHLPTREIAARAAQLIPTGAAVVTYCWGPGCNGATRAALEFARLGYPVKEMIGGYEYWIREGFPVRTLTQLRRRPADDLTTVPAAVTCDC